MALEGDKCVIELPMIDFFCLLDVSSFELIPIPNKGLVLTILTEIFWVLCEESCGMR